MTFMVSRFGAALGLLAALCLSGCLPSPSGQSEEEKEPHFLEGRSRVNAMDYSGAIESFEKALEVNPLSASAHFNLGWLFDLKEPDAAAAIYHYDKFLKLRPGAGDAENVKARILACKQELARTVSLGLVAERQQRDLDKLTARNTELADENKRLNEELTKWRAYYAGQRPLQTGLDEFGSNPARSLGSLATGTRAGATANSTNSLPAGERAPATHTHVVLSGETPSRIARKYGVRLAALMEANPHLDPRRMRPGQSLLIP